MVSAFQVARSRRRIPIEFIFPKLGTIDVVEVSLRKTFGKGTPAIINKLKTRQPLVDDELCAHDIIRDLISNESEPIKTLYRWNQEEKKDEEKEYVLRHVAA
jgi:hypothetical protein